MAESHTRRRALTLIGTAGGIALAGCMGGGGDDNEMSGGESGDGMGDESMDDGGEEMDEAMAHVRVAHLSPDAPNVDVYVDGTAVLEDVPFPNVSDYLELPAGAHQVTITAAGDPDTVAFEGELEVPEGPSTVAALGELSEENQPFQPALFEGDLSDSGENARVRLIHASPDAPAVDVTVGDGETVLFEDAAFGEAATTEVPGGEYTLEVRPATENNDGEVVATFDVAPEAGTVYTAFAVGYLEPSSAPADVPFDLEVVMDTMEN
ncbi:DUF4397 domain-containing protein [Natrinema sp. 1APR25-10V2]|uniref:DUF4397 domain-containing protein n=1 Tax=Natrinema sp. 1APR25-10V2 TaxID=2951081 RepID=UPI0028742DE8|nr:DUF4397 domain-containing protein [Natrinema sp. 1APR25-10V2]MDS0473716.1 DUF4397 domain-containing protein [Natrinema sp. 1APR25-10V2]